MNAIDRVKAARAAGRPTGLDFVENIFEDFFELHGDRRFADDKAVVAGIARLAGMPVTVIALEKGHSTKEKLERNFGSAHPEGYRKALRQMKLAEKFATPWYASWIRRALSAASARRSAARVRPSRKT